MAPDEWALTAADAAAAAVLLNSGLAKLVVPGPLRRALAELAPAADRPAAVRGLAAVEIAAAVALIVGPLRVPAAVLASLLGLLFAAFGVLGRTRRSTAPCGCFGASADRPLGWSNVAVGLLLAAVLPLAATTATPADHTEGAVLLASTGSLALCLSAHRELIRQRLLSRIRAAAPPAPAAGRPLDASPLAGSEAR
ncbi:MauE/DoxX family redox-associated membrane protein [Actinomadura sp. NPDC000600]|uniref:MauE/DoxX family redox-associated membrane protein n=1 Tax=Actinomadura sp. NPDC000600 TaxID=3154262 RepID=UPI0033969BFE